MTHNNPQLFQAYLDGLQRYLRDAPDRGLKDARKLGERALAVGLEILDLAKLHEEALIISLPLLSSNDNRDELIRVAGRFFAEAVTPIEGNHQAAREANIELKSTVDKLHQLTIELENANLALKDEIGHRKTAESSLGISKSTTSDLLEESLHLQEKLRLLSRRLLIAQEEERKRISRELHDIVAQALTGINVRLARLTLQADTNPEGIIKEIAATQRMVENSVDVVHRFARDLRPTVLDDLGLIPALKSYLKDFMERSGIRATLTVFSGSEELSSKVRTVLYRVAQEALTNVAHHSNASNAELSIRKLEDIVRVEIHDDGKGFDVHHPSTPPDGERLGLLGMSERVEMIGGHFHIESKLGSGTTIRVDIPDTLSKQSPTTTQ